MAEWNKEILDKIRETDDLHISPFREDGKTYGTPTWVWSVVVKDEIFVRAYNGQNSRWYKSAVNQKAGQIKSAGMTVEVNFEQVDSDSDLNNLIDDAYRKKYSDSPYLSPMIGDRAKAATIKIIPEK